MAKTETLGLGAMRSNFEKVRVDMRTRVARRAVVAGGRILKTEAIAIVRANGSVRSGDMVKNIAIKRESKAGQGVEQYHLGVRHGRQQTKKVREQGNKYLVVNRRGRIVTRRDNDPYYWRWVELGHRIVPRAVASGIRTYSYKLKNGKVVTRQAKYSGRSLRARRRARSQAVVGAKPFIRLALEHKRAEAIDAMGQVVSAEILKFGGGP